MITSREFCETTLSRQILLFSITESHFTNSNQLINEITIRELKTIFFLENPMS